MVFIIKSILSYLGISNLVNRICFFKIFKFVIINFVVTSLGNVMLCIVIFKFTFYYRNFCVCKFSLLLNVKVCK
jgi:hypothetical protein